MNKVYRLAEKNTRSSGRVMTIDRTIQEESFYPEGGSYFMDTSYTPVAYEYRETMQEQINRNTTGKVFFWSADQKVDEVVGRAVKLEEIPGKGIFMVFESGEQVRIDRIITFYGKPGAAFDEYDAFANACLACTAGVPL